MLRAIAITKRFGRTLALDGVDFEARPGEIHALVGENGAGKTTLMNVLAGSLAPDHGEVILDEKPLQAGSPRAALAAGIAAVHQSPMLFERMTWEENLALGGFDTGAELLDLAAVAARARTLAAKLGFELPPAGTTVENRSVAERVRLEVLRALSFNPRVLILDEPTSVLAPSELSAFLDLLRNLRGEGRIVVLITHKLAEAIAVADRITVLRRGRVVARTTPAETSEEKLAGLMIGEIVTQPDAAARRLQPGEPVLQIENLSLADRTGRRILDGLSFSVSAGEIVGIAGVDGNGQTELVELLAGVRKPSAGKIIATGAMAVIPQNRDLDGLILDMRLWENLILARPLRERVTSNGWLNTSRAIDLSLELIERFRIRAPGPETIAGALSGGNRQRLEVARAIASQPRIIVAHNICRGLDLAATAEVHRTLLDFASVGGTVLLISSDLDELLAICGRLLIISRGKIRETNPDERDPERLGLLMSGGARLMLSSIAKPVAALALAFALISIVLAALGANPFSVFAALGEGAFGNWYACVDTIVKSCPLIFTGLAVSIAFSGALWNIGADGQLTIGAIAAGAIGTHLADFPHSIAVAIILVAGALGGAIWGGIAGWLRARRDVNEVISTIMLNFVAVQALSWVVHGPLMEPSRAYPTSSPIASAAQLEFYFAPSRLNLGMLLAVVLAGACYTLLFNTSAGFELRAMGRNRRAATFFGVRIPALTVWVMALSGALAGLGGAVQVSAISHRLYEKLSPGWGFEAIAVALVARLNPLAIVPAALLFGALDNGSQAMQRTQGISPELVQVIQALVILIILAFDTPAWSGLRENIFGRSGDDAATVPPVAEMPDA